MKSALWKELRAKWAREAFVQAYGDVELPSVTIPYGVVPCEVNGDGARAHASRFSCDSFSL